MERNEEKLIQNLIKSLYMVYGSKRNFFLRNFVGGMIYGIGATVGVSLFLLFLGFIAHLLGALPFIGQFLGSFVNEVTKNSHH